MKKTPQSLILSAPTPERVENAELPYGPSGSFAIASRRTVATNAIGRTWP